MPIKFIPCDGFRNQSERDAYDRVRAFLDRRSDADAWVLFTNLAHSYSSDRQSDEIDQVIIGPTGVHVVEVKHWSRQYLEDHQPEVRDEARKLVGKVKKLATKLRRRFPALPRLYGKFLLTAGSPTAEFSAFNPRHGMPNNSNRCCVPSSTATFSIRRRQSTGRRARFSHR